MVYTHPDISVLQKGESYGKNITCLLCSNLPFGLLLHKNNRQPYIVTELVGHQSSAESCTGETMVQIPRIQGSETYHSGESALGNACCGGRMPAPTMPAPTKTWCSWHHRVNTTQKRYAICSALAASALPDCSCLKVTVLRKFLNLLWWLKIASKATGRPRKLVASKGKMRNCHHIQPRGPCIIYNENGLIKTLRNISRITLLNVSKLNIFETCSCNYNLPMHKMLHTDLSRILKSPAIQRALQEPCKKIHHRVLKKNPLKNLTIMLKLNPYAKTMIREQKALKVKSHEKGVPGKKPVVEKKESCWSTKKPVTKKKPAEKKPTTEEKKPTA
ncbi:unnamed protein product [Nyctereutes procyonoides]|uniref:(raccoon dog) hypothetical protein n=1 Tax=Nyctereutes procyonoides TaxID=34880 RepID=A0A811Y7F7_NYCPR|nr:unnamed protein product [Nyctereutes procyonoides]